MSEANRAVPMIEAVGLSKFYGDFAACRDITFSVSRGEIVAFLGPNGAGKSTTMKLLTGYLSPSEGVARIAGHDMAKDRLAGSRRLGYLPENGPLYPDMTPATLLAFFADARGLNADRKRDRIEAVVDVCALGSVYHKPISKLSKGYRQRVGIAQTSVTRAGRIDHGRADGRSRSEPDLRSATDDAAVGRREDHSALHPYSARGSSVGQSRDRRQRRAFGRRRHVVRVYRRRQDVGFRVPAFHVVGDGHGLIGPPRRTGEVMRHVARFEITTKLANQSFSRSAGFTLGPKRRPHLQDGSCRK